MKISAPETGNGRLASQSDVNTLYIRLSGETGWDRGLGLRSGGSRKGLDSAYCSDPQGSGISLQLWRCWQANAYSSPSRRTPPNPPNDYSLRAGAFALTMPVSRLPAGTERPGGGYLPNSSQPSSRLTRTPIA